MDNEQYKTIFEKDECEYFKGNVAEVEVKRCDCEIRADIELKKIHCVRLWGQVTTCEGWPVEEALVKLVKEVCWDDKTKLEGIAHTLTDCKGFYQFDICDRSDKPDRYDKFEKELFKVIVSKPVAGQDRKIYGNGECYDCKEEHEPMDDKKEYEPECKKEYEPECKKEYEPECKKEREPESKKECVPEVKRGYYPARGIRQ